MIYVNWMLGRGLNQPCLTVMSRTWSCHVHADALCMQHIDSLVFCIDAHEIQPRFPFSHWPFDVKTVPAPYNEHGPFFNASLEGQLPPVPWRPATLCAGQSRVKVEIRSPFWLIRIQTALAGLCDVFRDVKKALSQLRFLKKRKSFPRGCFPSTNRQN